jgi:hypothetical protein
MQTPEPEEPDVSITETAGPTTPRASGGDPIREGRREALRSATRETKPSPKTTELWITVVGVAVLTVVYNASRDASLNLFRACLLGTLLGAAYIVSRGFAKAGSHDGDRRVDAYEPRP